jgi:hypothetical protein
VPKWRLKDGQKTLSHRRSGGEYTIVNLKEYTLIFWAKTSEIEVYHGEIPKSAMDWLQASGHLGGEGEVTEKAV